MKRGNKWGVRAVSTARRNVLRGLLAGAGAMLASPVLAKWLAKLPVAKHRVGERALAPMAPGAKALATSPFSDGEQLTLVRMIALMLPGNGSAGAVDTGTDTRVLFTLEHQEPAVIDGLKQAIAAINGISMQIRGADFTSVSDADARQVMAIVAGTPQMTTFWYTLRTLAVLDFYAQPAAYLPLGLPGPNIDAGGFPGGRPRGGASLCAAS